MPRCWVLVFSSSHLITSMRRTSPSGSTSALRTSLSADTSGGLTATRVREGTRKKTGTSTSPSSLPSSASPNVKAIFHVFNLWDDREPSFSHEKRLVEVYSYEGSASWGWPRFMTRSLLETLFLADGCATFLCSIIVVDDDTIDVPPSDIGCQLGQLLDCNVGTDVLFMVNGETIPAHRAVLAARSPVFKAEVFGSTADATSQVITVKEIEPPIFKAMLRFMYTYEIPEGDGLGDSPTEMMQQLLAVSDRYQVDRLKLMSARWLLDNISVDTFASTIVFAETYNCPELKAKCIEFFALEQNFKKIVFTDGFVSLVHSFPPLAAKLKERVGI